MLIRAEGFCAAAEAGAPTVTFVDWASDKTNLTNYSFSIDVPAEASDDLVLVIITAPPSGTTTSTLNSISYNTGGSPVTPAVVQAISYTGIVSAGTPRVGIYHVANPATGNGLGISLGFAETQSTVMVAALRVQNLGSFGTPIVQPDSDGSNGVAINLTTVAAPSTILLAAGHLNNTAAPSTAIAGDPVETELFDDVSGTSGTSNDNAYWIATVSAPTIGAYNGIGCTSSLASNSHIAGVELKPA